jgi:hypothetical protein
MSLLLSDVASVNGARPPGEPKRKRTGSVAGGLDAREFDRRGFVRGATAAAVGVGLASLGLFRLTPPAFADGYDIYTDYNSGPCTDYAVNHECSPGCGPSPVAGGYPNGCNDGVCGSCWHRCCGNLGPNGAIHYLRPNECWSGGWDGWRWRCSSTVIFRCHDGWACYNGGCGRTVCRINTA